MQKFSLIDYPGKASAVVFAQGCNFRCPFCHNPELVFPEAFSACLSLDEVLAFLEERAGRLDGVVVTGGEPTLQQGLINFLALVKRLGYFIKVDTNGSRPHVLREVIRLKLVDYLAMDIKAPLAKYPAVAGTEVSLGDIQESIGIIRDSGLEHQFRTTFYKPLLDEDDLAGARELAGGEKDFCVQEYIRRTEKKIYADFSA
ncbi:MAG: anaerobic ribonucleoside-triphosphate reductase activating protein [Candidatus Omnitrophota bacterium]